MGGPDVEVGTRAAGSPPGLDPDLADLSRPRERPGQALVGTRAAGSPPGLDPDLADLSWPRERLGQALEALVRRSGLHVASGGGPTPAVPPADASAEAGAWLEWAAGHLGVEAEPVQFPLPELERGLTKACPMMVALHDGSEPRFLSLLKARGRAVVLVGPDLRLHRRPVAALRAALAAPFEAPLVRDLDGLLRTAKVGPRRRDKIRAGLLRERLAAQPVGGCWILRLPATAPFRAQLARAGLVRRLGRVLASLAAVYLVEIVGWALIGAAALDGRLDLGWLVAWLLLLVSGVPLRLGASWLDATFALDLGRLLKRRLLAGALRTDIDAIRHQGAGQLLGRVMESQVFESLALNGGTAVVAAAVELAFSAWILAVGAGGSWHLVALTVWLAAMSFFCWRHYRRLRAWSEARLGMTHELVEHMAGHRTRLAQEWPSRREEGEDRTVRDYLEVSRELDGAIAPIAAGAAGGWSVVALLGLAPAFVAGTGSPAEVAISLGGIVLAGRAFAGMSRGVAALSQAGVSWTLVSDLFRAAGAPVERTPVPPVRSGAEEARRTLVDASEVTFRYRPEGEAILRGLDLTVREGDKILLEGASGGGKSTLAALLTGLRVPGSGLLLLDGMDRATLGPGWHRLATGAPQFHENHILAGSLAFNLLMGRDWPASAEDLARARALCVELGLGDLLDRMPAGLMQQVGETGWQLSHGERSRVFLARALLQEARLTVLDESFAALDPVTLRACLDSAVAHARTLVVVAHP